MSTAPTAVTLTFHTRYNKLRYDRFGRILQAHIGATAILRLTRTTIGWRDFAVWGLGLGLELET